MKTLYKLFTVIVFVFFYSITSTAQSSSGSLSMTDDEWEYDWGCDCGNYYQAFTINVPSNTPIKFNIDLYTYDYLDIYTLDNGIYKNLASLNEYTTQTQSFTVISTTGTIYLRLDWGWNSLYTSSPVFSLNYATDATYSISSNPSVIQNDQFIAGKLGVGVMPTEKLEVQGKAIIKNNLAIGCNYAPSNYNLYLMNNNNPDATTSLYSYIYKNTTSSVYGLRSAVYNNSGNTYGIYSSVSGQIGKKWAGYFSGGDLEVVDGNLFLNSENSVISTKDDNLGIVKKYGQSPVWAVGSGYSHRFGKWSTPTLKGNISSGTFTEQMRIDNNGNVGIGTTNPLTKFDVKTAPNQHIQITYDVNGALPGCVGIVSINDGNTAYTPMGFYASKYYFGNGKVGIGTTNPDELLTVKGKIHAEEVIIDLSVPAADYVFNSDYSLMSLHKVEAFVKTNKHLPEIPSAAEVKEKGLSMGEMQNKLLQKIEELTLYVIELQKTNEKQSAEIEALKRK